MKLLLTGIGGSASNNFLDSLRLSKLDLEVIGVDCSSEMLALAPVEIKVLVPRPENQEYISEINRVAKKFNCTIIHAQPDSEVQRLSQDRDSLEVNFFLPDARAIILASDKESFAQLMRTAGVAVPRTGEGFTKEDFKSVCGELFKQHPKLWVRARRGAGSRASLPVTNSTQATNWIEWWIEEKGLTWSDFQVSEFLPGAEYALQTVWQDGVLIAAEARERIKYLYGFLTPSGQSSTPSVAKSVSTPEVYTLGINAIRALSKSPNGIYCVDIKTSYDGKLKVTEINAGRFFTTSNFFAHAGVNMPEMSIRASLGETLTPRPIASLGDEFFWIRMVDMGYKLVHASEMDNYTHSKNL